MTTWEWDANVSQMISEGVMVVVHGGLFGTVFCKSPKKWLGPAVGASAEGQRLSHEPSEVCSLWPFLLIFSCLHSWKSI